MKPTLGTKSLIIFGISFVILVALTLFESLLSGLPLTVERIIAFLLLVLPAVIGVILGVMSLMRKEPRSWVAILGVLLNGLSALFHIFLLSFAG